MIDWNELMPEDYSSACRAIKRVMPRGLRGGYDPEDFVCEAIVELMSYRSQLDRSALALLIVVARRRMIDVARSPRGRMTHGIIDVVDREPSLDAIQAANELQELLLRKADRPADRTVVELRCQGYSLPEIARLTGIGLRTVQRFFKTFVERNLPSSAKEDLGTH
jgi:DNA-directed RNA polymerase specialized sigma24 family protein